MAKLVFKIFLMIVCCCSCGETDFVNSITVSFWPLEEGVVVIKIIEYDFNHNQMLLLDEKQNIVDRVDFGLLFNSGI